MAFDPSLQHLQRLVFQTTVVSDMKNTLNQTFNELAKIVNGEDTFPYPDLKPDFDTQTAGVGPVRVAVAKVTTFRSQAYTYAMTVIAVSLKVGGNLTDTMRDDIARKGGEEFDRKHGEVLLGTMLQGQIRNPAAWIRTTAVRIGMDVLRKEMQERKAKISIDGEELKMPLLAPEMNVEAKIVHGENQRAYAALRQRAAVVLAEMGEVDSAFVMDEMTLEQYVRAGYAKNTAAAHRKRVALRKKVLKDLTE